MKTTSGSDNPTARADADPGRSRRRLLQTLSVVPLRKGLGSGGSLALGLPLTSPAASPNASPAATPACGADAGPTVRQTEGPYFTPDSPRRASLLESGAPGTRLVLSGRVLGLDCAPLSGALLDFWQADADGVYDNRGYRFRGHQFTDGQGRYRLETVLPGLYPGRTRHIHVKVQAPDGPVLTTQLYFPGEAHNRNDRIFSPRLLVALASGKGDGTGGPVGSAQVDAGFDFVIRTTN